MATILALVQSFTRLNGLPVPTSLVGSSDAGTLQYLELMNTLGQDIRRRTSWEKLTRRVSWTSTGVESQGLVTARCPENCEYIVPDTFWNTTTRQPIVGPLSDKAWQAIKAMVPSTPLYQYRIQQGEILVAGPIPVTDTLSLLYKSYNWLETVAASGLYIQTIAADTNVPVFPDELMTLGLKAFWGQLKRLDFKPDMVKYELACLDLGGVDNVKPVIDMAQGEMQIRPGIFVPWGNWPV